MANNNLKLEIYTPDKIFLKKDVYRVVLPYGNVNLTIIRDRAPTSLILRTGTLIILNENNETSDIFFIDGGVVDVAQNVCKISVQHIINRQKITLEQALQLQQKEPENAEFYQMITEYIKGFG